MTAVIETKQRDDLATARTGRHRWVRRAAVVVVLVLFTTELILGWSALTGALHQLRRPHVGWLALTVVAELVAMGAYALMQRRLLSAAGVRASYSQHVRLAYAAHSLNETLPGGPAFSTRLNYQQMRGFGASPAIASWAIGLSGVLSATALAAITVGSALATGAAADWSHLIALLAVAGLIVLGVHHLTRHSATVEALVRARLATFNRLRRRPEAEGYERVAGFLGQLRTARLHPADGLAAAALAVLNWLVDGVALWLCFLVVGERPAAPAAVILAFCGAMAAGSVTVVPGGLGIIDSTLILGLIAGGVTAPVAVAVVVLYRIISVGFIITLGWLFWLRLRVHTARPAAPVLRPAATRSGMGPRTSPRRLAVCPRQLSAVSHSSVARPATGDALDDPVPTLTGPRHAE
jgi:uncharacterized protein (TIRG00374 family)